jgi:hypothetical protein
MPNVVTPHLYHRMIGRVLLKMSRKIASLDNPA